MKKLILLAVAALTLNAASAQVTLDGSKFFDNWSITLKGGGVAPFQHYKFWPNTRGIAGVELRKQVTPVLGIGVEGEWLFNTSSWGGVKSPNIVDHQLVGAFGALNLANIFAGYKGSPRTCELEAVGGAGWTHAYWPNDIAADRNSWYAKAGMNINFNLGEAKAWTFSLKPAVVWYMGRGARQNTSAFNANHAVVEMQAGLTYHFKNSNGTHHFTIANIERHSQADIDAMNAQINDLRAQVRAREDRIREANAKIAQLQNDLDECNKRGPKTVTNTRVIDNSIEELETNVFFKVGKSVIGADQVPNVERVAIFLKNHKDATVEIKGYASPEGNEDLNIRLANDRAKAVRDMLVNKYKIDSKRIKAEGQGIGNMFSELEWNRVSICTITNPKK